ncbi:uncharacterized protein LOC108192562 isoform X3 [Daucus carota subsp. sativus]|uniref:uncharacterized protein LOC108192562 isoform X3 n=1 Tax=Daucus carota subsp. sativus TaxID=79200 RepID=UPI003083C5F3
MEHDEERWEKFKEDQWKRLRDIEEQSVPKMTDLEILAGKRRIKLQAGSRHNVSKNYSHVVGDYNIVTSLPVTSETLDNMESEISKKQHQHTQKRRVKDKAKERTGKKDDLNLNTSLSNSEYLRKIESEAREKKDERNKKRREKYRAQKEASKQDGLNLEIEARKKHDQLNQKRRAKYKAQKQTAGKDSAILSPAEQREARNKKRRSQYQNAEQREAQNKKRRSQYQNVGTEKREERKNKRHQAYRKENEEHNVECDASKVIVRTPQKFAALPLVSKRMRNKIKSNKAKFASSNLILDIGSADKICCHCGALMWRFEQTEKEYLLKSNKFSLCCGNGKVRLPLLRETPSELKALLDRSNPKRTMFQNNIRMYNNAFGFTSVGANMDKSINNGRGPFVYRIHGVLYHQIGSLFAEESKKPVFSQIYMYDNQEQVSKHMNFPNSEEPLDSEITECLSVMLHRVNALVDIYRQVRDRYKESEVIPGKLRLIANRDTDGRESNVPTNAYDFAGLVANSNLADDRDIVVHPHDGFLHRISVLHPCYMSLQYPLLFPWGEDGFRIDILHSGVSEKSGNKRDVVTIREYYCYRLQYRDAEGHTLIGGGRLFLQFVVDAWACIEHTRLTWVLTHQTILRSDLYNNVVDSVNKGDTNASTIGKRIVLPSSFTGSPRYMQQNYQDCMAICRKFGSPDLFITFTCNPQWPEIKEYCDKVPHCIPADRPDVMARVFKIKLELLLEDLTDNHVLGKVIGVAYTIEFQKRGLPHAHIIVWLEESDKCHSTDDIDQLICAEIPDKESDEIGYDAVSRHMIHGPCGAYNIECPCMKDGKCTKYYPKEFTNETTIDSNGYAVYRRRDHKHTVHFKEKDIEIDNRFVVPYNRGLLVKYQAHINIEWCNQGRLIKYMFKYVNKGPDRATVVVETANAVVTNDTKQIVNVNEVEEYVSCRYLSSAEACWRIFEFPIHHHKPVVIKLVFHLENEQQVYFREDETLTTVVDRIDPNATMFIQWFRVNREDPAARDLTFVEFPEKYFWDNTGKIWQRRKKKMCVIGRMVYVHPTAGERFYLRMLLNIVKGATSFEDVRTVNGVVYNTYKEACFHHGLLECDDEWHTAITDASTHQTGAQLRELFVTLLLFCDISDVRALWDKHWKSFSDDIEHRQRKHFPNRAFVINDEQLESLTLYDVDLQLRKRGKTLADFPTLPKLDRDLQRQSTNTLLYEENMYDRHALAVEGKKCREMLNDKQADIFDNVINNVICEKGGLFFVYGYGGTGKTFLWKTIINTLRSEGKIVLAVASSGIASLLIEGGRTAHSRFKIPIDIDENSTCDIKQQSFLAELIVQSDLIVWDEAPMNHKHVFEAVDRSIRDLMRHKDENNLTKPFGGKTVLLGGDFRQILPVLPRKGREDIVMASINKSYLWDYCKVFKLDKNMRIESDVPPVTISGQQVPYADWVVSVGDGVVPTVPSVEGNEPCWIEIPSELNLDPGDDGKKAIIDAVYGELCNSSNDSGYFRDRAILTPLNEDVDLINKEVMKRFTGQSKIYRSVDSVCKSTVNYESMETMYTSEYLNSLRIAGVPNHQLELKIGAPIVLLRNLAPSKGLCNGTRLIVTQLCARVIEAVIVTGNHIGQKAFIPRICMRPSDTTLPFTLKRVQFPVSLCYAMTINKSQGQTLKYVGLYLPRPVFSHGQFYVAISRVTTPLGLHIVCENETHPFVGMTKNVVYHEIFANL